MSDTGWWRPLDISEKVLKNRKTLHCLKCLCIPLLNRACNITPSYKRILLIQILDTCNKIWLLKYLVNIRFNIVKHHQNYIVQRIKIKDLYFSIVLWPIIMCVYCIVNKRISCTLLPSTTIFISDICHIKYKYILLIIIPQKYEYLSLLFTCQSLSVTYGRSVV